MTRLAVMPISCGCPNKSNQSARLSSSFLHLLSREAPEHLRKATHPARDDHPACV
jgi:hypothetical protein